MNGLKRSLGLWLVIGWLVPAAWGQEAATVSGVVTDAGDGAPLAGANVVLRAEGGGAIAGGAATDLDGRYRITDVAPGAYTPWTSVSSGTRRRGASSC